MNLAIKTDYPLRREHQLLLACARAQLTPAHRERIVALLQDELDWAFLRAEARHHRLIGLLHYHLSSLITAACPSDIRSQIRAEAHRIAAHGVRQSAELLALVAALEAAGIPVLSLKGPAAAKSLYGNVGLRPSADLDLLVRASDVEPAAELLVRMGYQPQLSLSAAWLRLYIRTNYEITFLPKGSRSCVDLHWWLIPPGYSFTPETDKLWERAVTISLNANSLRILGPEDSLLFYNLHAAKHGWSVLSLVVDIAQHIQRNPDFDWEFVTSTAIAKGAKRFLGVSLQLARSLLQADVPYDVIAKLCDEPCARSLAERAINNLLPAGARSAPPIVWPWPWRQSYFQALCRKRDRARYLYDMLLRPTPMEWQLFKLPVALSALYYPIRPARLAWRQLGRVARWSARKVTFDVRSAL